jgi:hypothetical protein
MMEVGTSKGIPDRNLTHRPPYRKMSIYQRRRRSCNTIKAATKVMAVIPKKRDRQPKSFQLGTESASIYQAPFGSLLGSMSG